MSDTLRVVSAVTSSLRFQANLSSRTCVPARCVVDHQERRPLRGRTSKVPLLSGSDVGGPNTSNPLIGRREDSVQSAAA